MSKPKTKSRGKPAVMGQWKRGTRIWTLRQGAVVARVVAGPGGWYWLLGNEQPGPKEGVVIAQGTHAYRRSRAARREAQKHLWKAKPVAVTLPEFMPKAA